MRAGKRRASGYEEDEEPCQRFCGNSSANVCKERDRDMTGPQVLSVGAIKSTGLFNNEQPAQASSPGEECV